MITLRDKFFKKSGAGLCIETLFSFLYKNLWGKYWMSIYFKILSNCPSSSFTYISPETKKY